MLAAVPERADPRDALVGCAFADLPTGASVATGSVRRRAQLAALRPDLVFAELRGNVDTRLQKAEQHDAIVVAAAALDRLGRGDRAAERLDVELMLPQVAQGALAVECRADDAPTRERLAAIDDDAAHTAVRAERAFLAELGGGCIAALCRATPPCVVIASRSTACSRRSTVAWWCAARWRAPIPRSSAAALAREVLEHGGQDLVG